MRPRNLISDVTLGISILIISIYVLNAFKKKLLHLFTVSEVIKPSLLSETIEGSGSVSN